MLYAQHSRPETERPKTKGRREVTSRTRRSEGPMSLISPITSHALGRAPPSQGRPRATPWIGLRLGSHESNSKSMGRCTRLASCPVCTEWCGLCRRTWRAAEASSRVPCVPFLLPPPSRRPALAPSTKGQVWSGSCVRHTAFSHPQAACGSWTWTWARTRTRTRTCPG